MILRTKAYFLRDKYKPEILEAFGMKRKGNVFFLPLTENHTLVCYPNHNGIFKIITNNKQIWTTRVKSVIEELIKFDVVVKGRHYYYRTNKRITDKEKVRKINDKLRKLNKREVSQL